MAEVLELEVKSDIGKVIKEQKEWNKELKKTTEEIKKSSEALEDVNKEGREAVTEMRFFGVSISGLKKSFTTAAIGAKFLFRTVTIGIASTGVGLLLLAFGSLATWFAKTKKGSEILSIAFKGFGAAVKVIVDRISQFGKGIAMLLDGKIREGFKQMGASFNNIGAEIKNDTILAMALEKAMQKLTDSNRLLNVETAQRRADIAELKIIAEDVTNTEKVRLAAAEESFKIETDLLNRRIANAEEAVQIEKLRLSLVLDPTAEALDVLAEKEIELANIRGESVTKQVELKNLIKSIEDQAEIKRVENYEKELKRIKKISDAKIKAAKEEEDREVLRADGWFERTMKEQREEEQIAKAVADFKLATIQQGFGAAAAMAGENSSLSKGVAAAQVIYNTQQGIMAAMGATSIADKLLPYPLRLANAISTGVMGAAALSTIMSTDPSGGSNNPTPNAGGGGTPAPQMMSGAFDIEGGLEPEAVQAFVVTDEMSNSQNQLANIRRRATI